MSLGLHHAGKVVERRLPPLLLGQCIPNAPVAEALTKSQAAPRFPERYRGPTFLKRSQSIGMLLREEVAIAKDSLIQ